jgi:hypothetical protein
MIGNNKMAEEETCEVGPSVAPIAIGWDKSEVMRVTMVTINRKREYVRLPW